ncbi:hypothetical protein [Suttonella ornithocola]|uniref:Peptidase T n=1 Tax=Suttonella ornithocola TaxID=279832 RepID=A0A380N016_9GAMM|nr:hypothetical protein [Suttonella ornithocola]SUO97473.1 Peptidase T [Suttonella ornithocola]
MKGKALSVFCRYLAIFSQSDESVQVVPSSEGQRDLARLLFQELSELELSDIYFDEEDAIVSARLLSNVSHSCPTVGFIAHLDTVDVALSPEIYPQRICQYETFAKKT